MRQETGLEEEVLSTTELLKFCGLNEAALTRGSMSEAFFTPWRVSPECDYEQKEGTETRFL